MRQYLDLTSWILLFALAPLTVLILLSQNTVPGDLFYPAKRGMENIILAAASVNPSTRVAFRTDLTERRFQEAQQLLTIKADITAYSDFVSEVSVTQQDLASFSNQKQKIELTDKLIAKIDTYQNQLTQVKNQVEIAQTQPQNIAIQITPAPATGQATPAPTQSTQLFQTTPAPTLRPQPTSTSFATSQPTPVQTPQAVAVPSQNNSPTPTPVASLAPVVTVEIANNPQKAQEVKQTITKTNNDLEKIKEKLKQEKDDAEFKQKVREEEQRQKEEQNKKGQNGGNNR